MHTCPTCQREFKTIFDYPRVHILSFERLPTPEAVDDVSAAAAEKDLKRRRQTAEELDRPRRGISMTPEIERACRTTEVVESLARLSSLAGREVMPSQLLPSIPVDRYCKKAYPSPIRRSGSASTKANPFQAASGRPRSRPCAKGSTSAQPAVRRS